MTSSSGVFMGLGFAHNVRTVEQVIELLGSGSLTGTIFVGVIINDSGAPGLRAYEGSDEITAKSKPSRRRARRRQR